MGFELGYFGLGGCWVFVIGVSGGIGEGIVIDFV